MKTAISIPDDVFQAAEEPCKRLGMSRSEFYAKPVVAFVKSHKSTRGKESLDAIYAPEDSPLDPALMALQVLSLPKADW
jgi:metal-responsive CopG/Arc/MetJ family transcriptional regulator